MLALTGGAPKEMIPVAGVPVLHRVVRECAASGVTELLVVIAPGKEAIPESLAPLAGTPGMPARIEFVVQPQARGLADAIRMGQGFAGEGPLAVALPDNLFLGDKPGLAQVIDSYRRHRTAVVSVVEIQEIDAERRGPTPVLPGRLEGDDFHIARIPDKGSKEGRFDTQGAPSAFTGVGRYVFTAEVWAAIDETDRALAPGAELDDVPVMQRLLGRGRLIGRRIRGRFLDVGLPQGHAEAEAILASSGEG
ncbi:MAG: sugar phosphate nucleotidyltransferase [Gemmatimonadota bacterium]|jgi:UTP--glucose-1-phosphate uridylyltransferase|nr:sugar phosphate nucleotidyltransferase [Gemmatimonadota bacterium]